MKLFKRWLVLLVCIGCSQFIWADSYSDLYKSAGWPVQVDHFDSALKVMQKQYKEVLPPFINQSIVLASNQQFNPNEMKLRGEEALKNGLATPMHALKFFDSGLGKKVVASETTATAPEELAKNKNGYPKLKISNERKELFKQLAIAIPYKKSAVDVSLALASIASDTVDSLLPGMGIGDTLKQLTPNKQQIQKQVDSHLENVLVYVYRSLSDEELEQFISFANSPEGKEYYQAAQSVINVTVNK